MYYNRRAYPGAPPVIPHPVAPDETFSQSCNACHEKGGFVAQYSTYTPLTPQGKDIRPKVLFCEIAVDLHDGRLEFNRAEC